MCGVGEKCKSDTDDKGPDPTADRRPVDPTPIVQLEVVTSDGEKVTPVGPRSRESTAPRGANGDGTMYMQSETAIPVLKNLVYLTLRRPLLLPLCVPCRWRRPGFRAARHRRRAYSFPHGHPGLFAVPPEGHRQQGCRLLRLPGPRRPQGRSLQAQAHVVRDRRPRGVLLHDETDLHFLGVLG